MRLDDQLARWLPQFPDANRITVRELLSHTSGVFDVSEDPAFLEAQFAHPLQLWKPQRILSYVGRPLFRPGADWSYSNTNYILLGLIVQKARASTVGEELRRRVLAPAHAEAVYVQGEESVPTPVMRSQFDVDSDSEADDLSDGTTTIPNTALATANCDKCVAGTL